MAKINTDMVNNEAKQFENIFKGFGNRSLGSSIQSVRSLVNATSSHSFDGELESIENDYKLMLDYMRKGFNDPQRGEIYNNLSSRLRLLASDLYMSYKKQHLSFFSEAARKSSNRTFSNEEIKNELEGFVTDVAMLTLEMEPQRSEKNKTLYRRHNDFMQALFCHIVVSGQWNEHQSSFFKEMLLSPTIDTIDAQLIISALTLATMNNHDDNKIDVLLSVYQKTTDEKTRQKALVGWVFALSSGTTLCPSLKDKIAKMMSDNMACDEVANLQKQIIFCINTEQDADKIKQDIIPELMKNNNLNITRFGITEKEEDPMSDVFDPGAADRAMEKMEESFQKMMNMQKAGSDIYFGGFSQMKRFPFFYNLANWFCPFYLEHPEISSMTEKLNAAPLLANILNHGPFCDSDKYSFAIALSSVISRLPANMKEMINSPEAFGPTISNEEQKSPAYIRRMILQDMYRFFKLYQQRAQLVNPFDNDHFMFIANKAFHNNAIQEKIPDLCFFMIKHKNKEALKRLIDMYGNGEDTKYLLIKGIYELHFAKHPEAAIPPLEKLTDIEPDNKRAMSLLARAYFETEQYGRAAQCYGALYQQEPDNKTTTMNYCIALTKASLYDEAANLLYRLDIEHPDSMPVIRVLAWTLMGLCKYEQAEKAYNRLLKSDDAETGDRLNAGYCQWLKGNIAEAANHFKVFIKSNSTNCASCDISKEFDNDRQFLSSHGISDIDMQLMADLVTIVE